MQVNTLLWGRQRQLSRLVDLGDTREDHKMQVSASRSHPQHLQSRGTFTPVSTSCASETVPESHHMICRYCGLSPLQLWRLYDPSRACAVQVMSHMLAALQPAFSAFEGRLSGVAEGHELPVLTGIVDLHAAVEALQVLLSTLLLRNTI